ncbi:DUF192 domain-containing protein [Ascidiimonas aurantiaca]|uniref:DUF192 domain-containing protein n=1 Tax=Ascidiimonas aurantiaca TaxID=1685432 RepID=UPI0030EE17A8
MKKYIVVFLAALGMYSCNTENKKKSITTQEVSFKREGSLKLLKKDSTLIRELEIEIADNDYEIQTGLMYRKSMKENRGMLFVFPKQEPRFFYMKNTEIPLDIIYINNALEIVSFVENAAPLDEASLPSNVPAKYVLEINGGLISEWNIEVGDRIEYVKD